MRSFARAVDPQRAERALRALTLVDAAGEVRAGGTSADLARLHVARTLAQIPSERIVERAVRISARIGGVAVVLAVCVAGVVVARGWSLLEGGDVLASRHGLAPLDMHWLDATEVVTRPPDYLHQPEQHELTVGPRMLPYGTVVTLRGVPLHAGRRLLLGDGTAEVPFVEDGTGAVVARWTLERSTILHVVARFGDVAVRDPDALELQSIPDESPVVVLEGAPGERRLVDATEDIPLRYVATDDHGLREVHLVLRSGTKEERRELAHLDGQTTRNEGGQVLRLRDSFLRKSHAPIQITVEAKDNDPLTGPKWGASPAITLIPPDVGEPEARRLDALRQLRDQLVDTLAWRVSNDVPGQPPARKVFLNEERTRTDADELRLRAVEMGVYGGVRIAARLVALLTAQSGEDARRRRRGGEGAGRHLARRGRQGDRALRPRGGRRDPRPRLPRHARVREAARRRRRRSGAGGVADAGVRIVTPGRARGCGWMRRQGRCSRGRVASRPRLGSLSGAGPPGRSGRLAGPPARAAGARRGGLRARRARGAGSRSACAEPDPVVRPRAQRTGRGGGEAPAAGAGRSARRAETRATRSTRRSRRPRRDLERPHGGPRGRDREDRAGALGRDERRRAEGAARGGQAPRPAGACGRP